MPEGRDSDLWGAHPSAAGQQAPITCPLIGQITASHRQLETINT